MRLKIDYLIRSIAIILSILIISSCTLFSPVKKESTTYLLDKIPCDIPQKKPSNLIIVVAAPESRALYNSTHIIYSAKPYQVAYYSQNEWAETPSQMLQILIVQALQNTHYFHAVTTPPSFAPATYILNTQILQLDQDFTHYPVRVRFTLRAQLSKSATNQIIATQQFCVTEPIRQYVPYGGIIATNEATVNVLSQLISFVLTHAKKV